MMEYKKITNIQELNSELIKQHKHYFNSFGGGMRSSKYIEQEDDTHYYVFNEIDGSDNILTPE